MAHTFKIYQKETGLWRVSYYGDIDPTIQDLAKFIATEWALDFKTREQAEEYCRKYIANKRMNEDVILRIPNLTEIQQLPPTDGSTLEKV